MLASKILISRPIEIVTGSLVGAYQTCKKYVVLRDMQLYMALEPAVENVINTWMDNSLS